MNGFEADPARLREAGNRVHDLLEEFAAQPVRRFSAKAGNAGDPELAAELDAFQQASATATGLIDADGRRLADRLHEAARHYHDGDSQAAEMLALAGPGTSPVGDAGRGAAPPAPVNTSVIQSVLG